MPDKIHDLIWWAFGLLIGIIAFLVKGKISHQETLEQRIAKIESTIESMTVTKNQVIQALADQKNDHRERIQEMKIDFKDARDTLNEQLTRQSRKLDLIFDRVMNRKHNERANDGD